VATSIDQELVLLCAHSLNLRHAINWLQPVHSVLNKLLGLRPELRLMQLIVIHGADSAEAKAWEATATAVHQCATHRAKRARHRVACADGLAGRVGSELVFAADVDQG